MGVITNHGKVSKIACPKCGAQPGTTECIGMFGFHNERWILGVPAVTKKKGFR